MDVKKRALWQLRDNWSVDAPYDSNSVGQRIRREYRYHPEEPTRQLLGKCMIWGSVTLVVGSLCYHRSMAGGWLWNTFDTVYFIEQFRQGDTSPRSKKYHRSAQAVTYRGTSPANDGSN